MSALPPCFDECFVRAMTFYNRWVAASPDAIEVKVTFPPGRCPEVRTRDDRSRWLVVDLGKVEL